MVNWAESDYREKESFGDNVCFYFTQNQRVIAIRFYFCVYIDLSLESTKSSSNKWTKI